MHSALEIQASVQVAADKDARSDIPEMDMNELVAKSHCLDLCLLFSNLNALIVLICVYFSQL